jgi:hypothetical protein
MTAEALAQAILMRMRDIEHGSEPGDDRYTLLWDACLDEITAACPDYDYHPLLLKPA